MSAYPQHLVYCIEYFRSELVKAKYLFSSLTLLSSIGTATLNSIQIKANPISNIGQIKEDHQDMQTSQDLIQIEKFHFKIQFYFLNFLFIFVEIYPN
jgi:hypothetical protein